MQYGGSTATSTAAALLAANFGIYAADYQIGITGTAGFSLYFSNSSALLGYLPASGTPAALNSDLLNPSASASGVFGGEVAALKLNIDSSDRDITGGAPGIVFGDLHVCGVTTAGLTGLNGRTVRQVLSTVQTSLGGGASGYAILTLSPFVSELNGAFLGGSVGARARNLVNGACP